MRGERLIPLLLGGALTVAAGAWAARLYQRPDPWRRERVAVATLMTHVVAGDSSGVAMVAAPEASVWLREVLRRQPALVKAWSEELRSAGGVRRGDTVTVALRSRSTEECSGSSSLVARLVAGRDGERVVALSSPCVPTNAIHFEMP